MNPEDSYVEALACARRSAERGSWLHLLATAIARKTEALVNARADALVAAQAEVRALIELHAHVLEDEIPGRKPNAYL